MKFFRTCLFLSILLTILPLVNKAGNSILQYSGRSSVGFTENKGQLIDTKSNLRPDILYSAKMQGMEVYFRKTGLSFVLRKSTPLEKVNLSNELDRSEPILSEIETYRIDMEFIEINPDVTIYGENPADFYQNYFFPHCGDGITHVQQFEKLTYRQVYPGIDLVFYNSANTHGLKYDFIVHPGANVGDIRIKYSDMGAIAIADDKQLHITTPLGAINEEMPLIYQDKNGERVELKGSYLLREGFVQFIIPDYDKDVDLVIDPWSTYYGGSGDDNAYGVAIDQNTNEVVITGSTTSVDFPATPGYFKDVKTGDQDVFVAKFEQDGNQLWALYYGGAVYGGAVGTPTKTQVAYGIGIDNLGNITVGGTTTTSDFPVLNAIRPVYGGSYQDGFVMQFDAGGNRNWATFYGGNNLEDVLDVAVATNGDIAITGITASPDFPLLNMCQLGGIRGLRDPFVARLTKDGLLVWSTFYGGNGFLEFGNGVAFDADGNILVTGSTEYSDFPVVNAAQPVKGAIADAFVIKFSNGLTCDTAWATFRGGNSADKGKAIITDPDGSVYVTGSTQSNDLTSPPGITPHQNTLNGATDAFLTKYDLNGVVLWSTYFGGNADDEGNSLIYDQINNRITLAGITNGTLLVSPEAYQPNYAGSLDNFLATFSSDSAQYNCATYLGGSDFEDDAVDIGIDAIGNFYITGRTFSTNFPLENESYSDMPGQDAFLTQICSVCGTPVDSIAGPDTVCSGETVTLHTIGTPGGTYLWSTGGTLDSLTVTIVSDTVIWVNHTVGSCTVTDSITIFAYTMPAITITGTIIICAGDSTLLTASGGTTYEWRDSVNTLLSSANTFNTGPLTVGSYEYFLYSSSGNCVKLDSVTVTVSTGINGLVSGDTTVCAGDSTILTASGGSTYLWSTGDSTASVTVASGNYNVIVSGGSCADTIYVLVQSTPYPVADAGNNVTICEGDATLLNGSGGAAGATYYWSPGGYTVVNPSVSPLMTTTYTLTVTQDSCISVDSVIVTVDPCLEDVSYIHVPNALSLTNTTSNNTLPLTYNYIQDFSMRIYNRWGELIFTSTNPLVSWNGMHKEQKVPAGVYIYVIKAKGSDGKLYDLKGTISVIK